MLAHRLASSPGKKLAPYAAVHQPQSLSTRTSVHLGRRHSFPSLYTLEMASLVGAGGLSAPPSLRSPAERSRGEEATWSSALWEQVPARRRERGWSLAAARLGGLPWRLGTSWFGSAR